MTHLDSISYGDEITSTSNDREKFATYTRDSYTGLDYADQRYYASTYGRFNTADQYMASAGAGDPQSWNRYSYVLGDPISQYDPTGRDCSGADGFFDFGTDSNGAPCTFGPGDFTAGVGYPCPPDPTQVAINALTGTSTPSCSLSAPVVSVAATTQPAQDDPCPGIASKIWDTITGKGMPGGKSLLLRVVQQITGSAAQFDGHQEQINNYRNRLTNLKNSWKDNDCDDPNNPPFGTNLWITDTSASTLKNYQQMYQQYQQDVAAGAAALAAGAAILQQIGSFVGSLAESLGWLAPVAIF